MSTPRPLKYRAGCALSYYRNILDSTAPANHNDRAIFTYYTFFFFFFQFCRASDDHHGGDTAVNGAVAWLVVTLPPSAAVSLSCTMFSEQTHLGGGNCSCTVRHVLAGCGRRILRRHALPRSRSTAQHCAVGNQPQQCTNAMVAGVLRAWCIVHRPPYTTDAQPVRLPYYITECVL